LKPLFPAPKVYLSITFYLVALLFNVFTMNLIIIVLIYTKGKVMKIILLNFYFIHISFLFILFQQIREIKSNMYVSFFAKYDLEKTIIQIVVILCESIIAGPNQCPPLVDSFRIPWIYSAHKFFFFLIFLYESLIGC
jgi:hypothetical protein